MEKPPILNDEQIYEYYTVRLSDKEQVTRVDPLVLTRNLLLAQRDADVEHFKNIHQETAREIFEEIEHNYYVIEGGSQVEMVQIFSDEWQVLKAKYIK